MGKRLDPLKNKDMLIWTWTILLWISAPNHLGKRLDPPKKQGYAHLNLDNFL